MKKKAKLLQGGFLECPFCGYRGTHQSNPGQWCAECRVVFHVTRAGDVVFDRDDARFALARTISALGGVRIGSQDV